MRVTGLSLLFLLLLSFTSFAATYYIAPTGSSDSYPGTLAQPWATFNHAWTVLQPGDTLIVRDGTYNQAIHPNIAGAPGQPITIVAENRGQAVIAPTSMYTSHCSANNWQSGSAIYLCSGSPTWSGPYISYITIDGLFARSYGESDAIAVSSEDNTPLELMTHNIIIRNTGAFGSAALTNTVVFGISRTTDSLFEDIYSYGVGRKALQAYGAYNITIRRAVLRFDYWDGSAYKVNDPRVTFSGYNTLNSTFENLIAIDSGVGSGDRASFVASGNEAAGAAFSGSENNKYLGMISVNGIGNGVEVTGGSGSPARNIYFKDLVIWNTTGSGFHIDRNTDLMVVDRSTFGGHTGSYGFVISSYPPTPITNTIITNSFSTLNMYSYFADADKVLLFANNSAINNLQNSQYGYPASYFPEYAPTLNYILDPQYVSGFERGARVVNRYVDGVLTNDPLWPYPNEDLIKQYMCNPDDLIAAQRTGANTAAWCETSQTLTEYIWEVLGNPCPVDICTYGPDTTPPTRSAGSPSGTLAYGTTSSSLSLATNEAATCRYSVAASQAYSSMTVFSTTGTTTHTTSLTGLTNGASYAYYIKCQDTTGNTNTNDYVIAFSVSATAAPTTYCGDNTIQQPNDGGVTEVCDGVALNGQTCITQGFTSGTLSCATDCLSFDTSACQSAPQPPAGSNQTLIASGEQFRYIIPTVAIANWNSVSFNDAAWLLGSSPIGYGGNVYATDVSSMQNNYPTLYTRKQFTVFNLSSIVSMNLNMDYDDGFIAYINGQEVARAQITGPITYNEISTSYHEEGFPEDFDLTASIGVLQEGTNVLAIEVHNDALTSSDLAFLPILTANSITSNTSTNTTNTTINTTQPPEYNISVDCSLTTVHCVDDTAGSTQEYTTIQAAVDIVQPGDVVAVYDGTYTGFTISTSGTSSNRITVLAASSNVLLNVNAPTRNDVIYVNNADYVTIQGFEVTGATTYGIGTHGATAISPMVGVIIRNNTVHDSTSTNIYVSNCASCLVESNTAYNSATSHGIYIANGGSDNVIVRGNIAYANGKNGLHFNGDLTVGGDGMHQGAIVENNIFYSNIDNAIDADGVEDSIFRNNIFYNNGRSGLRVFQLDAARGAGRLQIYNNIIIETNAGAAIKLTEDQGGHIIYNNILFGSSYEIVTDNTNFVSDYNIFESGSASMSRDNEATGQSLATWQGLGYDTNSFTATLTELFTNPSSNIYTLLSTSPAIDQGVASLSTSTAYGYDITGKARPIGTTFDVGAYEYGAVAACTPMHAADTNCNSCGIDLLELQNYISRFFNGEVTITQIIEVIGLWKNKPGC